MPGFQIKAKPRGGAASCPLCSETLTAGGPARECPGCEVSYHVACFDELGGCGTLGCPRAKRVATAPRRAARAPGDSTSLPPLAIGAVLAAALGLLLMIATNRERSEPPAPPRPQTPAERWKRPLDSDLVIVFVTEIDSLAQFRKLQVDSLGSGFQEHKDELREKARQAYESLLESERWTPAEIRAELRRRVKGFVSPQSLAVAEEIMHELFAAAEGEPVSGPKLTGKELELHLAAELRRSGKSRLDPEVLRHMNAARAYEDASRADLSPEQRRELRRVAELLAAGKDPTHPEVVQHVNAATAYEVADSEGLSAIQRRELRKAAALMAAGTDRNDPQILKHVDAAAAYGAANRRDLSPDQSRELFEAAELIAAGKDRNGPEVRRHVEAAAAYRAAARNGITFEERGELRQAAKLISAGKERSDPEVRRHVEAAAAYRASARIGISFEEQSKLSQAAELMAGGKSPDDPEVRKLLDAARARKRAREQKFSAELLSAHFVVKVCALAEDRERDGAPDAMAAARADYEKLLLVAGMSEADLQERLVRRVLDRVPRPGPRAERIMREIFAKERR